MSQYYSTFNLVNSPWIPVLFHDGNQKRVGLREVFRRAHEIRALATPNPLDRFALLRFLSIVAAWSYSQRPLPSWNVLYQPIVNWLGQHQNCFNLFGNPPRFYQDISCRSQEPEPVGKLFHEIPTGTNIAHFLHVSDKDGYGICPACCAIALLRLPTFSTIGGRGYVRSANPTATYAFLHAQRLSEAITWGAEQILKKAAQAQPHIGSPIWAMNSGGFLEELTRIPRAVWLHDPQDLGVPCLVCGEQAQLIQTIGYAAASGYLSPNPEHEPFLLITDLRAPFLYDDYKRASRVHQLRTDTPSPLWCVTFHADQAKGLTIYECYISPRDAGSTAADTIFEVPSPAKRRKKLFDAYFKLSRVGKQDSKTCGSVVKRVATFPQAYLAKQKLSTGGSANFSIWRDRDHKLACLISSNHSVIPTPFSRQLAHKLLAGRPCQPQQVEFTSSPQPVRDYVHRLTSQGGLKSGNLSILRALSGQDLARSVGAFDLFSGLYWPIRQRTPRAPQREDAWLVAKVYSKFPWVPVDNESAYITTYAAYLWRRTHASPYALAPLVQRLDRLVAARGREFEFYLLGLFGMIRRTVTLPRGPHPTLPGQWPYHAWSLFLEELRHLESMKEKLVSKVLTYLNQLGG